MLGNQWRDLRWKFYWRILLNKLRKDTKIRIFNDCVKSVLLYGCETWLVTKLIQPKIQTSVNRRLRYILRIWWPNIISSKDLWKVTGQEDVNVEIRKRKVRRIGHTLRKGYLRPAWNPYFCMDVKLGLLQRKISVKYKPLWIDV